MHKFEIVLKDGTRVTEATKNPYLDKSCLCGIVNGNDPFILIGSTVLAKDSIAMIKCIEEENEHEHGCSIEGNS